MGHTGAASPVVKLLIRPEAPTGPAFVYDDSGLTTGTSEPTGPRTSFQANPDGRMIKATDPDGNVMTSRCDTNGYLAEAVTRGGTRLTQTHDANGNLLTSEFGGRQTAWTHDEQNRVVSMTDPLAAITRYGYDGSSHIPSRVTNPLGATGL